MKFNDSYSIKKTLFGKYYVANQETGDVIDINQITAEILELIKSGFTTEESLINKLSMEYEASPGEIADDVKDIIILL